ncbi:MAG: aminotransferase class V-fold PLP-dependent enzyme [Nannocystaceae bacterium]|nr:aminotransferase class V-fold PLP-dependent enzyme [Nannocystaceae bacterium]
MSALAPASDFPSPPDGVRASIRLDHAASSPTPRVVLEAMDAFTAAPANVHRGGHHLAERATSMYERAREHVADFLGTDARQVVFTAGATAAIATVFAGLRLGPTDVVLAPVTEHHANLLPWLRGAAFEAMPLDRDGAIDLAALQARLARGPRPRLLACAWVSHLHGGAHPIAAIVALAHAAGVPVLVDAAQALAHLPCELDALGIDYLVGSGHKLLGPTGVGVLAGSREALERLDPLVIGGGAVERVSLVHGVTTKPLPWRLESGTPPIAAAIGLGRAVRYLDRLGRDAIAEHAAALARALRGGLAAIPGVECLGAVEPVVPITCFRVGGLPPVAVARALDERYGVLVRAGTLCAQPAFEHWGWRDGAVRASAHVVSARAELDALFEAAAELARRFAR